MQVVTSISLADVVIARGVACREPVPAWPEMALICSGPLAHGYAFSSFTRKPLNSGVYAFGSVTVGDSRFTMLRGTFPASS